MKFKNPVSAFYGGLACIGFPISVFVAMSGSALQEPEQKIVEEITVQRINIVEPDGSLKMVISNSARMHPGQIGDFKPPARERPAGVLFFDQQGDEAGGMGIVGDETNRYGGLVIDQLGNDESVKLTSQQVRQPGGFKHRAGLSVTDRNPDVSLPELIKLMAEVQAIEDPKARQARMDELSEQGMLSNDRLFVGRGAEGDVLVDMRDKKGVTRLRFSVTADGNASIEFLDENGKVTRALTEDTSDQE